MVCILFGALTGALFGAYDALYHGPGLWAADVLKALLMTGLVGSVLYGALGIALKLAFAVIGMTLDRSQLYAGLSGASVVLFAATVALVGTHGTQSWETLLVVAAGIAAGCFVAVLVTRRWRGLSSTAGLSTLIVAIAAVILATCGFALFRNSPLGWLTRWGPVILAFAGFWWVCRLSARHERRALGVGVVAIAALGVGFGQAYYRLPLSPQPTSSRDSKGQSVAPEDVPPHVVLIVLDTTRRDRFGCYGSDKGLTPEFDRLAEEGVVYEDAFSPSPWTMPSHASLFTGLHPVSHGCSYEHHAWLDDEFDTLAEIMNRANYETLALVSNFYMARSNVLQGFDQTVFLNETYEKLSLWPVSQATGMPATWADKGAGEALVTLDRWMQKRGSSDQPLFLFVNLFEAHEPYIPPYAERRRHLCGHSGFMETTQFALSFDPFAAHVRRINDQRVKDIARSLYDAEIAYQDVQLGRLIRVLGRYVDLDQTLLIVTADHGENLGAAGRWEHLFAVNDDLIHVPLIIRYPPRFQRATRLAGKCQTVDVFGTILDVAGISVAESESFPSLAPDRFESQDYIYAQVSPFPMVFSAIERNRGFQAGVYGYTDHKRVIHDGRFKLIWSSEGDHRLYDVVDDPLEMIDVSVDHPNRLQSLENQLNQWRNDQPPYVRKPLPANAQPLDPHWLESIRGIGYTK